MNPRHKPLSNTLGDLKSTKNLRIETAAYPKVRPLRPTTPVQSAELNCLEVYNKDFENISKKDHSSIVCGYLSMLT